MTAVFCDRLERCGHLVDASLTAFVAPTPSLSENAKAPCGYRDVKLTVAIAIGDDEDEGEGEGSVMTEAQFLLDQNARMKDKVSLCRSMVAAVSLTYEQRARFNVTAEPVAPALCLSHTSLDILRPSPRSDA